MYLGAKVSVLLAKGIDKLTKEALHGFRIRLDYFFEAASQIYKRLEFENTVLKDLEVLDPKCKLPSIALFARKFPAIVTEYRLQSLDMGWRLLGNHKFDFDKNVSAEEFWFHVKNLTQVMVYQCSLIKFHLSRLCCVGHIPVQTWKELFQLGIGFRQTLSLDFGLLHTKRMLKKSKYFDFTISSELVNKMTAS
ncbi:hypothetical protein PR048_026682, partial [Dryococelus australis]